MIQGHFLDHSWSFPTIDAHITAFPTVGMYFNKVETLSIEVTNSPKICTKIGEPTFWPPTLWCHQKGTHDFASNQIIVSYHTSSSNCVVTNWCLVFQCTCKIVKMAGDSRVVSRLWRNTSWKRQLVFKVKICWNYSNTSFWRTYYSFAFEKQALRS